MNKQDFIRGLRINPVVRVFAWPIENLRREYFQHIYLKSEDSAFVKTLRGKHQGQRCFIIGNGPSLIPSDLDKLTGEITFAFNRIYYIYPKTAWRPTYYFCLDNDNLVAEVDRVKSNGSYTKFINFKYAAYAKTAQNNLKCLYLKGHFYLDPYMLGAETLSSDPSHHCTHTQTSVANATELAIYMGFSEIYLLGVDNNYALKTGKDGKIYRDPTMKSSYFEGMRDADGKLGDGNISAPNPDTLTATFALCKKFADEKGVKIYNATRGGKLEIFERVDFDELIKSKQKERGFNKRVIGE